MEAFGLEPYLFEPEYTEDELRQIDAEAERQEGEGLTLHLGQGTNTASANNNVGSSELDSDGDERFCICGYCREMVTEKEKVCCKQSGASENDSCLSQRDDFKLVCLQDVILQVAYAVPEVQKEGP
ncbi:hypothetical protein HOLleu_03118 [Holothuria leucospilota]|uniref:Uncharacterized protein n=1 Tax=Holothuria leucospilota TaxID=206669 RepID=A0A9Q1HHF7_HOLLE|nr:hypothetical protein HOLleu_03118 [Holothuria leucospilota]